ncbi:Pol protein [Phytophthora palmivora]|uniref:Pol protein n=1 Tax=Phytophthora palmivora TaxID=4796 RepID=A0A2P4YFD8_9STRA|nr:Pol protein [Phytophthora palmivora]
MDLPVSLSTSGMDNKVPHLESETPSARSVEDQYHVFDGVSGRQVRAGAVHLEALPEVSALLNLEGLSMKDFLVELKAGEIAEMVLLKPETSPEDLNSSSVMDEDVLEGFTKQRATRLGSEILKNPEDPVYPLVKEYSDVVSKHPPSQLPPDLGVRHNIDLVHVTNNCATMCSLYLASNAFIAEKAKSGMVRESKSPHSTPTFSFVNRTGSSGIHAYNKLNNATVPAQTPIPRKDVALDLVDGYYQILMRESDIPLTAVSTPSGMLWEWLVMPQGLSNAPATFDRLVTQSFRPLRTFAQTYFDDIFVHSRAVGGQTAMEVHLKHLRRVLEVMRANKLYANIDKCVFAAEEIKVLGCFVSRVGVRAEVKAIAAWPTPRSQKDLRKWLGLANYLHKYSAGYAELARPLSDLLKKDADWVWDQHHLDVCNSIKASLQRAPVLVLADKNYTSMVRFLSEGKDAKGDRLSPRQRAQLHCYVLVDGLPPYRVDPGDPPRVAVPNDEDLKYDILLEAHDAPMSGHLGQEKTYQTVSQPFWRSRMYKWVAHYVRTCETCQKVKPSGHVSAPLQSLPVPADC